MTTPESGLWQARIAALLLVSASVPMVPGVTAQSSAAVAREPADVAMNHEPEQPEPSPQPDPAPKPQPVDAEQTSPEPALPSLEEFLKSGARGLQEAFIEVYGENLELPGAYTRRERWLKDEAVAAFHAACNEIEPGAKPGVKSPLSARARRLAEHASAWEQIISIHTEGVYFSAGDLGFLPDPSGPVDILTWRGDACIVLARLAPTPADSRARGIGSPGHTWQERANRATVSYLLPHAGQDDDREVAELAGKAGVKHLCRAVTYMCRRPDSRNPFVSETVVAIFPVEDLVEYHARRLSREDFLARSVVLQRAGEDTRYVFRPFKLTKE